MTDIKLLFLKVSPVTNTVEHSYMYVTANCYMSICVLYTYQVSANSLQFLKASAVLNTVEHIVITVTGGFIGTVSRLLAHLSIVLQPICKPHYFGNVTFLPSEYGIYMGDNKTIAVRHKENGEKERYT